MSLLEVENLSFRYADELLYKGLSMRVFDGEHVALVGPNGVGKSTLLKILYKEISPDEGDVTWINNKKIGYLDQYAEIEKGLTVKKYLYDVFEDLFEKERTMEKLYESIVTEPENMHDKILHIASSIGDELIQSNFYAIKSSVGNILNGLGLSLDLLDEKIHTLSGGMRAKLILGKLLLEEADVLLLDEPTNFLDVKHIEWLAKFLKSYPKTFIVISHNEFFLKEISTTVLAIENKEIARYKGNYDYYLKERELRYEIHKKNYESQKKQILKTEDFIQRNIVRATTTKRAQSRRKMLEKIVRIEKPIKSKLYHFSFPFSSDTGRDVLVVNDLEIGYTEPLIDAINTKITKSDKVVITGKNGVGKSTFLKTILEIIPKIAGEYKWIDTANIGYFEQESSFEPKETPFMIVQNKYPKLVKKEIMQLLAQHGIDFEMANREIDTLSGGEKTKVRIALMRYIKRNVLIFDEPTNHLDQLAKEALREALVKFPGTIILVSHEKDFYNDVCDYEIEFQ